MEGFAAYPSLAGRRVFITGGATGIGAGMVEAFCEHGAIVGFLDLAEAAADALTERLAARGSVRPWFRRVDVTDTHALQAAIEDFAAVSGGLEALVNNVANDARHDPLGMTPESWRACLAVNLDSTFFAAQRAIALMTGNDTGGSIINLSSINALLGPEMLAGYVTAKAGILGLTKSLARQYGPSGIRVNAVLPGWVATERQLEMWLTAEAEDEWMSQVPLKQRIEVRDVANLVLFLAADDSRMITNQRFVIDGGRT